MKIALLGNPNTGKSSVFNMLTGLRQQVGNFPGVTVDKKFGVFSLANEEHTLIDFPGIYSIYPRSKDEQVVYDVLKNETDVYYKTDTHINLKGAYIVYKFFINTINSRLNINIQPKNINITSKTCALNTLPYGIGDLTWKTNLQDQQLDDIMDTFYFNEQCLSFYLNYKITIDSVIRFLDYKLIDNTNNLVNKNVDWDIISKYIIYKKNTNKINMKVLIFYDSFLLSTIPLYLELFNEIYLIKTVYSNDFIKLIQPNYVFEFRVERFLF
jgi:ribosome-interacting GTPase 1